MCTGKLIKKDQANYACMRGCSRCRRWMIRSNFNVHKSEPACSEGGFRWQIFTSPSSTYPTQSFYETFLWFYRLNVNIIDTYKSRPFFLPPAFEHPKPLRTVGIEINTGQTWSCLLIFAINIYIKATRTLFLCFSSKLVIHLITFSTLSVWYDVGCWFNNFPMLQVNVDEAR